MPLQPFTRNFQDNSTDAGFQFTFFCDLCSDGYKTQFIESKTHKKGGLLRGLGRAVSIGGSLLGSSVGYRIEQGTDILSERFQGMSPEWHKEHETAFEAAQNEAKEHFSRCPNCRKYVCETDWNEQEGLCVECGPRENIEVATARSQKMVKDIQEKADQTRVFDGAIESKVTICPSCGKPSGAGKFCNNCGAPVEMGQCSQCGAKNPPSVKFCGECGNRLE